MLISLFLVGCASDPARRAVVADREVARLAPPIKPLTGFSEYTLIPISMSADVQADEDKVAVARELGTKLNVRLTPLLDSWRARKHQNASGTLVIEPKVQELRVVSGGARFFVGAWMGESFINLDLKLTDSSTGQVIATPRIWQNASAEGGKWSIGATDRNLLDYIVDTVHRYLEVNHTPGQQPLKE